VGVDLNELFQTLIPLFMVGLAVVLLMRKQPATVTPADDRLLQMIDRLQRRVDDLERQLAMMHAWATRLSAQVVGLGAQPIAIADIEPAQTGTIHTMSKEPARLLALLKAHFSSDEIESLALELGASEGTLGDGTKEAKARRLVRFAEDRGKTLDLAFLIWRERPNEVK
jgi:hypothetical protein